MNLGPPPSAAGPPQTNSFSGTTESSGSQSQYNVFRVSEQRPPATAANTPGVMPQSQQPPLQFVQHSPQQPNDAATTSQQPHPPYYLPSSSTSQSPRFSHHAYPPNTWGNAWPAGSYTYGAGPYQHPHVSNQREAQISAQLDDSIQAPKKPKAPSPSPSPPPELHKEWDAVIKSFLSAIGFSQALRGFEADMIVLNPDWERKKVPTALGNLMKGLLHLGQVKEEDEGTGPQERPLDDRKLDYIHLSNGSTPQSQTSINNSIAQFLAKNRGRNDASNRAEFLQSLAEKRRQLAEAGVPDAEAPASSCARTDAKPQNRDVQMKYDIAKNEDGPLRKTLKHLAGTNESDKGQEKQISGMSSGDLPTAERHPALDERLRNIEAHLAVRYVPSPPRSLLDRLKFLENHIVHLEKEYPPWAALHFNQPNRGWPPPPRPTPIIVPSHLTSAVPEDATTTHSSTEASITGQANIIATPIAETTDSIISKGKGKQARQTKSSLHRAVMERLEVQKARNELAGLGDGG